MRRFALLALGVLAVTWLQFEVYPGHSYLNSGTQLYVPMLERLDAPGYLSRDLVAAHPNVAYTIYDEVTLLLHETARLTFKTALESQQMFYRAAAVIGVLLLALSAGTSDLLALLIATCVNLGAVLWAPALIVIDQEPVPRAFAFGLILLAAGLLTAEKPLLAGFAGGIALVYAPVVAAPFWAVAAVAFFFDKRLRSLLRPALTILLIFVLLLANFAQLQPGVVESASLFGKLSPSIAAIQRYRTPQVWVSMWPSSDLWSYLSLYICGLWATVRIWQTLPRMLRWLLVALPFAGILSVPCSYLALDKLRWNVIPQTQPAQVLVFTIAFTVLACGIAGARAAMLRKKWEASLWFLVVFAIPVNSRILDLLRISRPGGSSQLAYCVALALAVGLTVAGFRNKWRYASLLVPVLAIMGIPTHSASYAIVAGDPQSIVQLADWAEMGTWGSSMFLFPDAARERYPGVFRAASRRAVWVDWTSGALVDEFESVAGEWWERWQSTMEGTFSAQRLQNMLSLPIDYYVLKKANQLSEVRPVFHNREFVVYDAADLRRAIAPLTLASQHTGSSQ